MCEGDPISRIGNNDCGPVWALQVKICFHVEEEKLSRRKQWEVPGGEGGAANF